MKKTLLLSVFMLAALASNSWAQFCCYEANTYNQNKGYCGTDATCTDGVEMSSCAACDVGIGTKDEGIECEGYCKWGNDCERIKTNPGGLWDSPVTTTCEAAIANCDNGGQRYESSTCTGTVIGGKEDCGDYYCKWDTCVKVAPDDCAGAAAGTCTASTTCAAAIANCNTNSTSKTTFSNSTCTISNASSSSVAVSSGSSSSSAASTTSSSSTAYSSSSTQQGGSSSSVDASQQYGYCIAGDRCLTGPFTFSQCTTTMGGLPTNDNCVEGSDTSSSSSDGDSSDGSSSSGEGSSSSSSSDGELLYAHCIVGNECRAGSFTLNQCFVNMGGLPSNDCSSVNNTAPIKVVSPRFAQSSNITAMQNSINLQSASNAMVQVYDLKGKIVRAYRLPQGSHVVSLSGLPRGLYIVKASNVSWKQTIKVTVK